MSVIQSGDIESKDFSEALPAITNELNLLVNGLRNTAFGDNCLEPTAIHGLAHILEGIEGDLEKINEALYPARQIGNPPEIQGGAA
jgi:hypothetical protein